MKSILTLFIVGTLSVAGRANTDAVLRGIRIVETQDQLHPPRGKLGERGPYQFRRDTWRMHTSSSFALAENREVANTVARRHYAWIESRLASSGVEPSPYNIALAWNAGVNAVIRHAVPAVSRDYAERVLNLAASFAFPADPASPAPRPAWKPPVLYVDDPVQDNNQSPEPLPDASAPAAVVAATTVEDLPAAASATDDDSVSVRFYSDPILLALNRTPPAVTETTPAPLAADVSSEALLLAAARM